MKISSLEKTAIVSGSVLWVTPVWIVAFDSINWVPYHFKQKFPRYFFIFFVIWHWVYVPVVCVFATDVTINGIRNASDVVTSQVISYRLDIECIHGDIHDMSFKTHVWLWPNVIEPKRGYIIRYVNIRNSCYICEHNTRLQISIMTPIIWANTTQSTNATQQITTDKRGITWNLLFHRLRWYPNGKIWIKWLLTFWYYSTPFCVLD